MNRNQRSSLTRLKITPMDIVAIACVLALAGALAAGAYLSASGAQRVEARVYKNGELIYTLPLDIDGQYTVSGEYENTITVQNGRIAVTQSSCPGEDCVHTGWISRAGRGIVCLPNRLEIRLTGASEVDAVVE